MRPSLARSIVVIFSLPIFLRAPLLLGFLIADPFYRFANLGSSISGPLAGMPQIDPNVGFVDQALTMRALDLLAHGSMPWWNAFEGFGVPLAGEMQDSALFPLSALIALPNGPLYMSIVLAILAGLGMLVLLRRLDLAAWPALVGALAFQMCGTFSWLSGAWTYAIPWLPFLILGIELCRSPRAVVARRGIVLVAAATALLLYSGFIETSYLEGLVAVIWALARLFAPGKLASRAYVLRAALGGVLGIAIGAPILVAFIDTLSISFVGMHDAAHAGAVLVPPALLQKFAPYIFGPIFATHQSVIGVAWGTTGGYVGFGMLTLAITGIFGTRARSARVVCAVVLVFGFTAMFGGPLLGLVLAVPGVKYTAYYRYIDPAIAFATAMLAAFALDDVLTRRRASQTIAGFVVALAVFAYAYAQAQPNLPGIVDADLAGWRMFATITFAVTCAIVVVAVALPNAVLRTGILGSLVIVEAALFLVIPTLSNPGHATVAIGGVAYLRQRIGFERVYTFGPIGPNYGSYVGIPVIDYADVPTPKRAVDYIASHLDAQSDGINFLAGLPRTGPSSEQNFASRIDAFENVGVRYVLTAPGAPAPAPDLAIRYRDSAMQIFELPNPADS